MHPAVHIHITFGSCQNKIPWEKTGAKSIKGSNYPSNPTNQSYNRASLKCLNWKTMTGR